MIILVIAVAVVIMGVPLAAVALVTLASRHEEHARSISGRAPGILAGAARRLLGFRATGLTRPACRAAAGNRQNPGRNAAWAAGGSADGRDPIGGPALAGGSLPLR
jgi:hypothetical protein